MKGKNPNVSQKASEWTTSLSDFDLSETSLRWVEATRLIEVLEETFSPICLQLLHTGFDEKNKIYRREVVLCHRNTPLIFARTSVSLPLYHSFQEIFDSLNEKPIGKNFLYTRPDFTRSAFEYRWLTDQSALPKNIDTSSLHFARRSFFEINVNEKAERLCLKEVFLGIVPSKYDSKKALSS
jgi:chorismate-pyruvate lyase